MRTMTVLLCLFLGLTGCGPSVNTPKGAKLSVFRVWTPSPGELVEIPLSPAEWESIRHLLPDLEAGERKHWKNMLVRMSLDLHDGAEEVAGITFEGTNRVRISFPDHTSTFQSVSPDLEKRLIEIAKSHGHWK